MDNQLKIHLLELAKQYNTKVFISADPIGIPSRFQDKKDIEIAAFISQWMAYGKREMFLKVLNSLAAQWEKSPWEYIQNKQFTQYKDKKDNLYRFFKYDDYYQLCNRLYDIYFEQGYGKLSMEEVIIEQFPQYQQQKEDRCIFILKTLISLFENINGIPKNTQSSCKRLCMFLRWMVRRDKIVDFGLWQILEPQELIIPLDTHVFQQSKRLGLCTRKDTSMRTAMEITNNLRLIHPQDPTFLDFALFAPEV